MAHEQRDSLAKLEMMSKAIRETIHAAEEEDLDEAIKCEGETPEAVAEKGRIAVEMALAEYEALLETPNQEINRQQDGYLRRRNL